MLKDFTPRLYQETIFSTCTKHNSLVVLPTGLGKTAVALMLAVNRLSLFPNSKIIFLTPTKPLAEQHLQTFKKHLDLDESAINIFTGDTSPEKRIVLWENTKIALGTPQGFENDVIGSKIKLEDVSLLIIDEAHKATGNFSYVWLAQHYIKTAKFPKILALTASPGSKLEKIDEVCKNLAIEAVEIRTYTDADVRPYIQETDIKQIKVDLPIEFLEIKNYLETCMKARVDELKKYGMTRIHAMTKTEILDAQRQLHAKMASGERDFNVLKSISLLAELIKVHHTLELLESQGISPLYNYFIKIFQEAEKSKSKAVKNLACDFNFKSAFIKTEKLFDARIDHPKFEALKKIVEDKIKHNQFAKIIIFTQFRDTAVKIKESVSNIEKIVAEIFVGQAKKFDTGLSQKEQKEVLDRFRDGAINVLCATSVAEEGLDIPSVDLVIFYEPVPSAIRSIQRRGRTGRQEKGEVILLVAKNTRDEAYNWSAKRKEQRMYRILEDLKHTITLKYSDFLNERRQASSEPQTTLLQTTDDKLNQYKIFADYREKSSGLLKELINLNVQVNLDMLDVADYILSSRVGVELKTVPDFVASIIDGRLLNQLKALTKQFERPLIILQGEEDIYSVRNIHPNAIRGMLATITVSYGIPMIHTKNEKESALFLLSIARREQELGKNDFSPHANNKSLSLKDQQEYLVSCFPNVGLNLAKTLLEYLGSVKNIINSDEETLKKIPGVGDKIAKCIKELSEGEYKR